MYKTLPKNVISVFPHFHILKFLPFCEAIALIEDSDDKASAIKDQKLGRNEFY